MRTCPKYNFTLSQGSDRRICFRLKNKSEEVAGLVDVDLTGFTGAMQLRRNIASKVAIDTLTSENGRIEIDPETGRVTCIFTNEATQAYPAMPLVYDLEVKSSGGTITRVIQGVIRVTPEVTKVG